jgi:hypothetical protein
MGLWATVHACEIDLARTAYNYEYVVVTNGEPVDADTTKLLGHLGQVGKLVHLHCDEALAPPVARQRGAAAATGNVLFFFDNHCLPRTQYFERALLDFENPKVAVLHSTTWFYTGGAPNYHYRLTLGQNFWGTSADFPQIRHKPYRIAAGGHGGFAVRSEVWNAVGGYGPEGLFVGYAGEELAFDLAAWRRGYEVWLDPKVEHYHFAGTRPYSRHYTDEYYTNLLASAHLVGGEAWLFKVFKSLVTTRQLRIGPKQHLFDLLETAYRRSASHALALDAASVRTLDETLAMFRREGIAH